MNRLLASLAFSFSAVLCAQNQAITLVNGVDGYVEIPYSAQVVPQAGITVEAWITYDDTTLPTGYRYPTVFRQNLAAQTEDFFLRINADNIGARILRWKVITSGGAFSLDWPFASGQLNTWTHVAATYDGATMVTYINGAAVASRAASGAILDRGGVLRIGKGSDIGGPIEVWNGSIDEARMWPFARTQAAIAGSMSAELSGMPGLVSTWNLNGGYMDSSSTLHATATGSVSFTSNAPALQARPFFGSVVGASSNGCLGAIPFALTGAARAGNAGFGLATQRAPGAAPGLVVLSPLPRSTPLSLLGINIWVDLTGSVALNANANALGAVHFALPIPPGLSGLGLAAQFVIVDACGPQGLTASNALVFLVMP